MPLVVFVQVGAVGEASIKGDRSCDPIRSACQPIFGSAAKEGAGVHALLAVELVEVTAAGDGDCIPVSIRKSVRVYLGNVVSLVITKA